MARSLAPPQLASAIVVRYRGLLYDLGLEYWIEVMDGELWIVSDFFTQLLGRERSRMRYLGDNEFAVDDDPNRVRFDLDAAGHVKA